MRSHRGNVYRVRGFRSGYRGQITIAGTKHYRYFIGNKPDCVRQCREWQDAMTAKHTMTDRGISWALFRDKWNEWAAIQEPPLARRTVLEYNYSFDRAEAKLKPVLLGDMTMRSLRLMITGLEEEARKAGQDNYGVNKVIICIRAALRWAMNKGYVDDFPVENLALLPVKKPQPRTDGLKSIEAMLRHGGTKERCVVLLGFDCGLRPEEIFNLRWEKLNLETRFGWISPNPDGWHPKCNKNRQFRITERLAEQLRLLGAQPEGYVITNAYGAKFTQQGYNVYWRKFVKKVNRLIMPDKITGTLKTLRKDFCTYRQSMGADTKAVSVAMGHADTKVTQQHYTDSQQEALRLAREQEERENLLKLEACEVPLKFSADGKKGGKKQKQAEETL